MGRENLKSKIGRVAGAAAVLAMPFMSGCDDVTTVRADNPVGGSSMEQKLPVKKNIQLPIRFKPVGEGEVLGTDLFYKIGDNPVEDFEKIESAFSLPQGFVLKDNGFNSVSDLKQGNEVEVNRSKYYEERGEIMRNEGVSQEEADKIMGERYSQSEDKDL